MVGLNDLTFNSGDVQPIDASVGNRLQITVKKRHVSAIDFEDINFRTDHAILMPDFTASADVESGSRQISGLAVVKAALDFVQSGSIKQLLVAGHTDSKGSSEHNLKLSEERARNAYLYLSGQREKWAAHCTEHAETDDGQQVLKWVSETFGWDCDPGAIDNDLGPATRKARDRFRDNYNREFGGSLRKGAQEDEKDWSAHFDLYETELARLLSCEIPELRLRREKLIFTIPAILGCSEHWPKVCVHSASGRADHRPEMCPDANEFGNATNRRVELLFFDLSELPRIEGIEPPGRDIYGPERFAFAFLPIREQIKLKTFVVRLFDHSQKPIPNAPYELDVAGNTSSGLADESGFLKAKVEDIPEKCKVRWSRTGKEDGTQQDDTKGTSTTFDFEVEVFVALDGVEETEAITRRLHNLGYPAARSLVDNLRAFQKDHGLEVTGELRDVRGLLIKWHDSAEPEELKPQQGSGATSEA